MANTIYKVSFFVPVDGCSEYFFGSLAAIFDRFSAEQIGSALPTLYGANISASRPKVTRLCVISKHSLFRKPHKTK
jgi:hypothetical protein